MSSIIYQCEASSYTNFSLWFYEYINREERSDRIQVQLKAKTPCYLSHTSTDGVCKQGLAFNNTEVDDNSFQSRRTGL